MRTSVLLTFAVMAALGPPEALANKVKFHNLPGLAIDSDVIIIASSLRAQGAEIALTVSEYLVGGGPEEIKVLFKPYHGTSPVDIANPRLVFLSSRDGKLALTGVWYLSIWPQGTKAKEDGRTYPHVGIKRDLQFFADLAIKIRGCADVDRSAECEALILDMYASSDPFINLVARETCLHLYNLGPKYRRIGELGAVLALDTIDSSDPGIANLGLNLSLAAPKSAVLPVLLELIQTTDAPSCRRNHAFSNFMSICRRNDLRLDFQPDPDEIDPHLGAGARCIEQWKVRARYLEQLVGWCDREFPAILASDYERFMDALKSKRLAQRTAGRIWLRAATGSDFGFDESGTLHRRTAALARVQEWWEKTRN